MRSKALKGIPYFVPLLVIMVLVLWYRNVNYYPKLYGDEFGYWASGAFFAGLEWNDVTALNEYYGWGYGLLLSIILRLPISAKACYISAVAFNGVMLWGIYVVYYRIASELFVGKCVAFRSILAFLCAFMPSTLYYTQLTASEVILEFVYCLLIYEFWKIFKEFDCKRVVKIAFLATWLLSIHMRTLGIIVVTAIAVVCVCFHLPQKRTLNLALFALSLFIGVLVVNKVKSVYQAGIALDFLKLKLGNTASGQVGKLHTLFTMDGMKSFLANLLGRLFSIFVNSYLMVLVAVLFGTYEFVRGLKNKHISIVSSFFLLCIFNSFSLIAISALYMIGTTTSRFDILTYSRYHEFATGILIMLGFYYFVQLVESKVANYMVISIFVGMLGLSKFIASTMDYNSTAIALYAHNPRVLFFYRKVSNTKEVFILMLFVALCVFLLFYVLQRCKCKRLFMIGVTVLVILNIYESNFVFREGCLSWCEREFSRTDDLQDYVVSNGYERSLCCLADDNILKIDPLCYALKTGRIVAVNEETLDDKLSSGYVLIATSNYAGAANLEDYELIYESNSIYLWRAVEN